MENDGMKIVEFDKYCKTCEYSSKKEHEEPCSDCLNEPVNMNSHKPVKYEKRARVHREENTNNGSV
jgi:hypothetical protein